MKTLSSPRLVSAFVSAMLVALMLAAPLTAYAAEAEDVWAAISVELYDLDPGKEPTLVMSGLVSDDLDPPIDAAIAIPKGSEVIWIGQVVDGVDPGEWPALEPELVVGDEYDMVYFTLDQSPRVNVELTVPEGFATSNGETRDINVVWISGGVSERARVGVSSPHQAYLDDPQPEPLVGVRKDDIFYSVETSPVAEGTVLTISGTLRIGEAPELIEMQEEFAAEAQAAEESAAAAASAVAEPVEVDIDTGTSIPWLWIVLGLLGLAIAAIIVLVYRTSTSPPSDDDDGDSETDDADESDDDDSDDDGADTDADAPAADDTAAEPPAPDE